MISSQTCGTLFRLFLIASGTTIRQRIKTLFLSLRSESEDCFSKLRKRLNETRLRQAQKNKKSKNKRQ